MRATLNGNGGEQEVADHVLQAHDQAEQDLTDKEADGRDEVGLCNRLRFVLHGQFSLSISLGCWAASWQC
jgi:hypothetical protein